MTIVYYQHLTFWKWTEAELASERQSFGHVTESTKQKKYFDTALRMHLGRQGCAFPSGAVMTTYFTVYGIVFPSLTTIESHFKGQRIIKI